MTQIIENTKDESKPVTYTRVKNSKKHKARELYVKYSSLDRDQIIQKFIEELEMRETSARTYVSMCAKELNEKLGKEFRTRKINRSNSKRVKAFQIYKENFSLPRKEIIVLMRDTLQMSYNSAATHCSLAHKAYFSGKI